jgi:hypothetical protein
MTVSMKRVQRKLVRYTEHNGLNYIQINRLADTNTYTQRAF